MLVRSRLVADLHEPMLDRGRPLFRNWLIDGVQGNRFALYAKVHHAIIDGAIDTEWIATNFPQRHALKDQDGILNPDHIADAYWMLHAQPRDAWTHELDLRPWMEKMA